MASFLDQTGARHELPLALGMYREAAAAGQNLPQFLAANYATDTERYGSVFQQAMMSEGIFPRADRAAGFRASTMDAIMNGTVSAGVTVKDGIPTSRILFPAVFMEAIEDKLVANLSATADAFDQMIARDESINGERYEQPIISLAGAEAGRSQGIAQLAKPASMMTITTTEKAYRIPTFAIGLEVSDQAMASTTMDFVAMSLARQAAVERNERAQGYMLALLNGDVDNNDGSLASLGLVDNSSSFDPLATGGVMTDLAWMKFLRKNSTKRKITHLVTDFDTAWKLRHRSGQPNEFGADPKRPDMTTQFKLMNPSWAQNPEIFLTEDASWPAGTFMGLDKSWAIRRVRNLSASYQAIEQFVLSRSTVLRIDFAEHVNRLYPEAFAGMVLV